MDDELKVDKQLEALKRKWQEEKAQRDLKAQKHAIQNPEEALAYKWLRDTMEYAFTCQQMLITHSIIFSQQE